MNAMDFPEKSCKIIMTEFRNRLIMCLFFIFLTLNLSCKLSREDNPSGKGHQIPQLTVIPVNALNIKASQSKSRFLVYSKDGLLKSKGRQDVSSEIRWGIQGRMIANHWGIEAEHGFLINHKGWGNGLFSADITTEPDFPITFKVAKEGYVYLCGKGSISIKDGGKYELGYDINDDEWILGLESKDAYVREGSCEAVARLGLKKAVPKLLPLLKDPYWKIRRNAAEALGILGDTSIEDQLFLLKTDENAEVIVAVNKAISLLSQLSERNEESYMYQTRKSLPTSSATK